jgi:integrase
MPLKLIAPRKGKTPNWSVRGTYLGHYVDRSTGSAERRVAKDALAKWKGEIERGVYGQPTGPTFVTAAAAYMQAGKEGRRRGYIMRPLLLHFADTPLARIDQQAIDAAALALYPDASPATRNRQVYTPVQAVLKHAGVRLELRRPKGALGEARTDWLWPEQAFKLFKEADKIDPEFGLFLRFLTYTGLRLSEALNLKVADVQLGESFAFIPETKSGDPRPVYLTPSLVVGLERLVSERRRVGARVFRFTKSGRFYRLFHDAKVAAGLPRLRPHDLRHTYATWMRRYAGLDTRGLVATGAWRDSQAAERYQHAVTSEEAKKASLLPTEDDNG